MVLTGVLGAFLLAAGYLIIRLALKAPKPPEE